MYSVELDKLYSENNTLKNKLKEYEQNYDALFELCFGNFSSIDDFEKAKKDFLENTEWRFN